MPDEISPALTGFLNSKRSTSYGSQAGAESVERIHKVIDSVVECVKKGLPHQGLKYLKEFYDNVLVSESTASLTVDQNEIREDRLSHMLDLWEAIENISSEDVRERIETPSQIDELKKEVTNVAAQIRRLYENLANAKDTNNAREIIKQDATLLHDAQELNKFRSAFLVFKSIGNKQERGAREAKFASMFGSNDYTLFLKNLDMIAKQSHHRVLAIVINNAGAQLEEDDTSIREKSSAEPTVANKNAYIEDQTAAKDNSSENNSSSPLPGNK